MRDAKTILIDLAEDGQGHKGGGIVVDGHTRKGSIDYQVATKSLYKELYGDIVTKEFMEWAEMFRKDSIRVTAVKEDKTG